VLLAHTFLRKFASELRRPGLSLSEEAIRKIEAYAWPGNVRELQNIIKRATIMADGTQILASDIGLPELSAEAAEEAPVLDLRIARERAERQVVIAALARADGSIVRASELLGVSRPTLYDLMEKLQIKA
jgi:two-component system NtrC family response regulator